MTGLFLNILNRSIAAGWLVLAVLLLRLVFRKAPKWIHVLLWGLVAVRLLCPVAPESALSLIPSAETVSPEIMLDPAPAIHSGVPALNSAVNPVLGSAFAPEPLTSVNPLQIWIPVAAILWGIGMAALLVYAVVSYGRLRRRVRTAVLLRENIFQSEQVHSPFVLGVCRPRIYLPFQMDGQTLEYVIAHEQAHIRRRDHWWKLLGFLLLTVHWFHPLMWLAYGLLCRDMELACDEKVIRELGTEQRADYSQALLVCSAGHRRLAACPLAFGEVGVKQRVKNVLHYRKPALWLVAAAILACAAAAVCFWTNPVKQDDSANEVMEWFNYHSTPGTMDWADELETSLPAFPGVTFRWTPGQVLVDDGAEETVLISGMPVWNVFFADLTGDGLPELCATVSYGSGIVDTHVVVVDYASGQEYTLWERMRYDYALYLEDGVLQCSKNTYNGAVLEAGPLELADANGDGLRLEIVPRDS